MPTALLNLSPVSRDLLKGIDGGKVLDGSARFVIKYLTGANEANGFRNASEFTFKLEFVK